MIELTTGVADDFQSRYPSLIKYCMHCNRYKNNPLVCSTFTTNNIPLETHSTSIFYTAIS